MGKYPKWIIATALIAIALTTGMLGYNLVTAAPLREILVSLIATGWAALSGVLLIDGENGGRG